MLRVVPSPECSAPLDWSTSMGPQLRILAAHAGANQVIRQAVVAGFEGFARRRLRGGARVPNALELEPQPAGLDVGGLTDGLQHQRRVVFGPERDQEGVAVPMWKLRHGCRLAE